MLPFDPHVLLVAFKAYLLLCVLCTAGIFTPFALEQRAYNRQLCRRRERERLRCRTAADQERYYREHLRVIGGSGGRR